MPSVVGVIPCMCPLCLIPLCSGNETYTDMFMEYLTSGLERSRILLSMCCIVLRKEKKVSLGNFLLHILALLAILNILKMSNFCHLLVHLFFFNHPYVTHRCRWGVDWPWTLMLSLTCFSLSFFIFKRSFNAKTRVVAISLKFHHCI